MESFVANAHLSRVLNGGTGAGEDGCGKIKLPVLFVRLIEGSTELMGKGACGITCPPQT